MDRDHTDRYTSAHPIKTTQPNATAGSGARMSSSIAPQALLPKSIIWIYICVTAPTKGAENYIL